MKEIYEINGYSKDFHIIWKISDKNGAKCLSYCNSGYGRRNLIRQFKKNNKQAILIKE
jgi:hypothetical protein